MNGVFKFKENIFLKYKREIALSVGAIVIMASVAKFIPSNNSNEANNKDASGSAATAVEEQVQANGYTVKLNGSELGVVQHYDEGQDALYRAIELMIAELGYNPEIEPQLDVEENFSLDATFASVEDLAAKLKVEMISNIDEIKVKAYVMKIGDDFTVAVSDEDSIREVLKNAQEVYLNSSEVKVDIQLASDGYNSLVKTPEVVMVKEGDSASDRLFTAEPTKPVIDQEQGDEVAAAATDSPSSSDSEQATDESTNETEKPFDPMSDGETVSVGFAEQVLIVQSYVSPSEIKTIDEATELITKENEEPKVYVVQSGDVPSLIAQNNEMGLSELYKMNPGLEENATKMQIGDELTVMIPEPELSVEKVEKVVYTGSIARGVTYVDNPDKYAGSDSTTDAGYDGIMEYTAMVSKINGEEVGRSVIAEVVLKEPKDKVVSRGVKPLPAKGATGNYISPLAEYRVSSPFGYRWGGFHYGIDLAAPTGTGVRASDGGTVTIAGWYGTYGYLVELDHGNGVRTRYAHNSKILVTVGQRVAQYEEIAKVGSTGRSTGPHCHFEIRFDGTCANPADYVDF